MRRCLSVLRGWCCCCCCVYYLCCECRRLQVQREEMMFRDGGFWSRLLGWIIMSCWMYTRYILDFRDDRHTDVCQKHANCSCNWTRSRSRKTNIKWKKKKKTTNTHITHQIEFKGALPAARDNIQFFYFFLVGVVGPKRNQLNTPTHTQKKSTLKFRACLMLMLMMIAKTRTTHGECSCSTFSLSIFFSSLLGFRFSALASAEITSRDSNCA